MMEQMHLLRMGFLFPIAVITDECTFTWAAQSLQLAKGGDVFREDSVCKGQLQPGSVWHPQLLCPGVQTNHFSFG